MYGKSTYILGIRTTRDYIVKKIQLDQGKHTKEILKRFHMKNCKAISNLI